MTNLGFVLLGSRRMSETGLPNVEFTQRYGFSPDSSTLKRNQYNGKNRKQGSFSAVQLFGT
jgi:hypothetical protein